MEKSSFWKSKKNRMIVLLLLILYFAVAYPIMSYFEVSCVFKHFFSIPCPGCGMTKAALSLLKLDFLSAAQYNPIVFFMPYVFFYVFCDFKHKKVHNVILICIGIFAIINWVRTIICA